jgi:hypothetical protein
VGQVAALAERAHGEHAFEQELELVRPAARVRVAELLQLPFEQVVDPLLVRPRLGMGRGGRRRPA